MTKWTSDNQLVEDLEEFKYTLKRLRKTPLPDSPRKISAEELNKVIDTVDTWLSRY